MRVKIRILGEAFVGQFAGPGPEFYDNRTDPARKKRNRFRPLEVLGYKVMSTRSPSNLQPGRRSPAAPPSVSDKPWSGAPSPAGCPMSTPRSHVGPCQHFDGFHDFSALDDD